MPDDHTPGNPHRPADPRVPGDASRTVRAERADRARRLRLAVGGGTVLVAVVVLTLVVLPGLRSETIVVEVAPGTAQRLAAGEEVDLLPRTLEVSVGDRLEITNRDEVTHEVGPYTVAAGQTLRQTFTSVGTLEGACTLHPSGAITIVVR